MTNISPFNFSNDSSFCFDLREKQFKSLIENIEDLNIFYPDEEDIIFLENLIQAKKVNESIVEESNFNAILPQYKDALIEFSPGIYKLSRKMEIILSSFKSFRKRENITLKKICKKYRIRSNSSISESYVKGILNNKFNIRYLKTVTKTNKLNSKSSKLRAFFFIKVIIKALKMGLKVIYLDESNFQLQNNHLKIWRKRRENPYFKLGKKDRRNIIAAISNENLLLYKINSGTNNSTTFLEFMKELVAILKEDSISDSLIVMDNCSIHMTNELKNFYKENKLKIISIVPYFSELNGIEFLFNYIKQKIYKKVFCSFSKLIDFIEGILNDDSINDIVKNIFTKSLRIYKEFILKNKSIDLDEN